jgi:hypothetical protein
MRLGSFKYNFPEFQCMRNNYAKNTFHCISAIITQWLGQYTVLGGVIFLWQTFAIFKRIARKFLNFQNNSKQRHNCLRYERALKIFYFHILNMANFG